MLATRKQKVRRVVSDQLAQYHFRAAPELIEAVGRFAEETHRSKNMAISVLLEEALKRTGHWPLKVTNGS